jgi:hypothetical protein
MFFSISYIVTHSNYMIIYLVIEGSATVNGMTIYILSDSYSIVNDVLVHIYFLDQNVVLITYMTVKCTHRLWNLPPIELFVPNFVELSRHCLENFRGTTP